MARLWVSGYNGYGQLGLGQLSLPEDKSLRKFTQASLPAPYEPVQVIRSKGEFTLIVGRVAGTKNCTALFGAGDNEFQSVCSEKVARAETFVMLDTSFLGNAKIKKISSGLEFVIILTEDGRLFCSGNELLPSKVYGYQEFVREEFLDPVTKRSLVKDIEAASYHIMVLLENSDVYALGCNSMGQLGIRWDQQHSFEPLKMDLPKRYSELTGELIKPWKLAGSGLFHIVLLEDGKTAFAIGDNAEGQLGTDLKKSRSHNPQQVLLEDVLAEGERVVDIYLNDYQALYLTNFNKLIFTGENNLQLFPQESNIYVPKRFPQEKYVPTAEGKVVQIKGTNTKNFFALTANGDLWAMGVSEFGELGTYEMVHSFTKLDDFEGDKIVNMDFGNCTSYIITMPRQGDTNLFSSALTNRADIRVTFS